MKKDGGAEESKTAYKAAPHELQAIDEALDLWDKPPTPLEDAVNQAKERTQAWLDHPKNMPKGT